MAAGTPLLEIGNLSNLEIVIDVPSTDALKIKPRNVILVQAASGTQMLKAKVRRMEPLAFTKFSALGIEEQRVNIIGDFIDPASLGDGYRSDVQVVVWQSLDVLKLPPNALYRCNQAWCVFSVQDRKAQEQIIEISQRSTFEAEVRFGLQAGEPVILYPNEQVKARTRVKSLLTN